VASPRETPAVFSGFRLYLNCLIIGHYRALGRVIHVKYLKEQLETRKKLDFSAVRETMDNFVERLDIFADTIYIEVSTERDV